MSDRGNQDVYRHLSKVVVHIEGCRSDPMLCIGCRALALVDERLRMYLDICSQLDSELTQLKNKCRTAGLF